MFDLLEAVRPLNITILSMAIYGYLLVIFWLSLVSIDLLGLVIYGYLTVIFQLILFFVQETILFFGVWYKVTSFPG